MDSGFFSDESLNARPSSHHVHDQYVPFKRFVVRTQTAHRSPALVKLAPCGQRVCGKALEAAVLAKGCHRFLLLCRRSKIQYKAPEELDLYRHEYS